MINAGSPGSNCCSEKMITDTKNSVGISCNSRLPRKLSILSLHAWAAAAKSLQPQSDHTHQPVRHLRVAFELGGMRNENAAVIEIDLRHVIEDELSELLVDRLAGGKVRWHACLIKQFVGLRVFVAHRVLRGAGLKENIGVAVRIGAPAPGQHKGLVIALLGLLECCLLYTSPSPR